MGWILLIVLAMWFGISPWQGLLALVVGWPAFGVLSWIGTRLEDRAVAAADREWRARAGAPAPPPPTYSPGRDGLGLALCVVLGFGLWLLAGVL